MRPSGSGGGAACDAAALREEAARMAWLREEVDRLCHALRGEPLAAAEAEARIARTRRAILARFPTKTDTYEWVYAPRFARIFRERYGRPPEERVVRL